MLSSLWHFHPAKYVLNIYSYNFTYFYQASSQPPDKIMCLTNLSLWLISCNPGSILVNVVHSPSQKPPYPSCNAATITSHNIPQGSDQSFTELQHDYPTLALNAPIDEVKYIIHLLYYLCCPFEGAMKLDHKIPLYINAVKGLGINWILPPYIQSPKGNTSHLLGLHSIYQFSTYICSWTISCCILWCCLQTY